MPLSTTGISGLDAQLGGGVPRGCTLLLLGDPGNAISVFSEQFAAGGVENGENVFYYEFDRPVNRVRDQILGYTRGVQPRPDQLKVYDGYSTQFGRGASASAQAAGATPLPRADAFASMLRDLQSVGRDRPYRLVVESLSAVTTRENQAQVVELLRNLTFLSHELGGIHLVSLVKGLHDPVFETQLKHLASGVLEMGTERKGFGLYSYLMVTKLLNVADPVRILLFKETDKGLWLESTKRVF